MKIFRQVLVHFLFGILFASCLTENGAKKYIIEHQSEIVKHDSVFYKIDSCRYRYFTDITVRFLSDSTLYVIFWGDRDSWLWDYRKDKNFTIDVPYNRCKGYDVELDVKVIEAVNRYNK